jgi:hypothetical protein
VMCDMDADVASDNDVDINMADDVAGDMANVDDIDIDMALDLSADMDDDVAFSARLLTDPF